MLHMIMHSPFQSRALEQALMHWQEGDQLLLLQDGVLAACAPQWLAQLAGRPVYVLDDDLNARGLTAQGGQIINLADWVNLIAEHGSPLNWPA